MIAGAFPIGGVAILSISVFTRLIAAVLTGRVSVPAIAMIVVMALSDHGGQAFHAQPVLEDEIPAPPGRHGQKRRAGEPSDSKEWAGLLRALQPAPNAEASKYRYRG